MYGRGNDVLVVDADICAFLSLFVEGTDRAVVGFGYGGNDNGASVDVVCVELDAGLRAAITIGSLVHHVDLFRGADGREVTVVTNAYEQPSSLSIGKGRDGACELDGILYAVLEVLLLMLALADQALQVSSHL